VTRVIKGIGIDRYTAGKPGSGRETGDETTAEHRAEEDRSRGDSVARVLGKLVAFYVYFVAILAAADVLAIDRLTDLLSELAGYLPVVLGAIALLVVGFIVGRIVGDAVADLIGGFRIGPHFRETPLEPLSDREGEFGRLLGAIVTYYIYLLTLLAVADMLDIAALSELLRSFAGYVPALIGGLLVLLVGIWFAEMVGRLVRDRDDTRVIAVAALAVKLLIYYVTITIALAAIGLDVGVLTTLFSGLILAVVGTLAIALGIGIGVAVGLGGQDYVRANVDDWVDSLRRQSMDERDR
jgi:small-conductance mechanosensitive channel